MRSQLGEVAASHTRSRSRTYKPPKAPSLAKVVETRFARNAVASTHTLARAFRQFKGASAGHVRRADFHKALQTAGVNVSRADAYRVAQLLDNGSGQVSLPDLSEKLRSHLVAKATGKYSDDELANFKPVHPADE